MKAEQCVYKTRNMVANKPLEAKREAWNSLHFCPQKELVLGHLDHILLAPRHSYCLSYLVCGTFYNSRRKGIQLLKERRLYEAMGSRRCEEQWINGIIKSFINLFKCCVCLRHLIWPWSWYMKWNIIFLLLKSSECGLVRFTTEVNVMGTQRNEIGKSLDAGSNIWAKFWRMNVFASWLLNGADHFCHWKELPKISILVDRAIKETKSQTC